MATSTYIIPFNALMRQVGLETQTNAPVLQVTKEQLVSLVRKLLIAVPFDEAWYTRTYPDVEDAIRSGVVKSAKDHFIQNGYFEGRLPAKINVDEEFYLSRYPDIAEGIDDGEINSAQEHFETHGFIEGRLPFEV